MPLASVELLLATRSAHKASEIREILGVGFSLLTLDEAGIEWRPEEEELEPFETFEENAASKARYFCERSGRVTIADDSGLEVDALGGAPGVRTKRFAPEGHFPGLDQDQANNRYLLESLAATPETRRGARYVCVAVLCRPTGDPVRAGGEIAFRGEASGRILVERRGSGGFGYDPLFLDLELGNTFAELAAEEKNARSHRGKAFRELARHLNAGPAGVS